MKTQPFDRCLEETRYRLTREVREHPLLCLGLALGAGVVIGAIGGRSTAGNGSARHWLTDLGSDLSERAHDVGDRALKVGNRARRELRSAAHRVADAAPDIDYDKLVSRGRHWLRSVLS
jgi:hypothetical protein